MCGTNFDRQGCQSASSWGDRAAVVSKDEALAQAATSHSKLRLLDLAGE